MIFGDLKIGPRLALGFGLIMIFMVMLTGLGISRMSMLDDELREIVDGDYEKINMAILLHDTIRENAVEIRNVVLLEDANSMFARTEIIQNRRQVYQSLRKKFEEANDEEKTKELLEKIEGFAMAAHLLENDVIELGTSNRRAQASKLLVNELDMAQRNWMNAIQELIVSQRDRAARRVKEADEAYITARSIMVMLAMIALAMSALIALSITFSVTRPIKQAVKLAARIAAGDLTTEIRVRSKDETGQLLSSMKAMNDKLKEMVASINSAAALVGTGAQQISAGNLNLSQRTEEQASSLEETASSMEELTGTVRQNADNAKQANQLAVVAREKAESGGEVVHNAVRAMNTINVASKRIADIVGVIDEIAFQTNLLALNAAVEAARAGEQGRGFAVVAAEVRNLAQRSAASAKEIKGLIQDSVMKVDDGARLVDESGVVLAEIVTAVKKVSDIVAEIAAASLEQSTGIEHINKAITQMDDMTQQNAALVEEAAAASRSMEDQAQQLNELMAVFKLRGKAGVEMNADEGEQKRVERETPALAPKGTGVPEIQAELAKKKFIAAPPQSAPIAAKSISKLAAAGVGAGKVGNEWREF
jgi:methyl-accepting chemotaxis protein